MNQYMALLFRGRALGLTRPAAHQIWLTLVFCFMSTAGCNRSEALGKVYGKVTFRGQPVSEGQIQFSNSQLGVYMTADIQADGTYEVICAQGAGLPPGSYQTAVMPPPHDLPLGSFVPKPRKASYPEIPTKYHDAATSGLTLTVTSDGNQFDVDMQP